jgi:hypothetical protein
MAIALRSTTLSGPPGGFSIPVRFPHRSSHIEQTGTQIQAI